MSYTRRKFVKCLSLGAGMPVLAPILGQLEREAYGATETGPKRCVFVAVSSGIMPEEVEPPSLKDESKDKYLNIPLDRLELEPALKPLEPLKNCLTFVQGVRG